MWQQLPFDHIVDLHLGCCTAGLRGEDGSILPPASPSVSHDGSSQHNSLSSSQHNSPTTSSKKVTLKHHHTCT
jgi:hypothetical protein